MPKFRGHNACSCLVAWLPEYESALLRRGLLKKSIDIFQLIGSAPQSAGTHTGGGCFDLAQFDREQIRVARQMGAATWHRTPAQGFIHHSHGVLKGCPHAAKLAKAQVISCEKNKNGLANNGKDDGPRTSVPFPMRTYKQGIEWAKAQAVVSPAIPTTPAPSPVVLTYASSVAIQNCASKRSDPVVGGKWAKRVPILAKAILDSDASFIVCVELYNTQRPALTKAIAAKYAYAGHKDGRVLYYRKGRWTTPGGFVWKYLRAKFKAALGDSFTNVANGTALKIVAVHLSWDVTATGAKNRKTETSALLSWTKSSLPKAGRTIFAGDFNAPADASTRADDVEPIFEAAGYHDLEDDHEVKNGPGGYHLDRVFGGKGVTGTKVVVRNHAGSDHGLTFVQFDYTKESL